MDLFRLSNLELDSKIKTLAHRERELLHEVLLHIQEADRRRLYLELAYPNLYEYLTEGCGFSEGAAQRRIDAARLMNAVPDLGNKIENGKISLSQVSFLQKAIREKNKVEKVSTEQKQEIVDSLCAKSMPESQKLIAQSLDLEMKVAPKVVQQKDESVRLELTFTKDQWEQLMRARELLSNTSASNSWTEMFSHLANGVIKQKIGPTRKVTATVAVKSEAVKTGRAPIPTSVKRNIFNRDKCCQYKDKKTGKICGSRWGLEIDHIQPIWASGNNDEANLRLLCRQHNQYLYQQQTGMR